MLLNTWNSRRELKKVTSEKTPITKPIGALQYSYPLSVTELKSIIKALNIKAKMEKEATI